MEVERLLKLSRYLWAGELRELSFDVEVSLVINFSISSANIMASGQNIVSNPQQMSKYFQGNTEIYKATSSIPKFHYNNCMKILNFWIGMLLSEN